MEFICMEQKKPKPFVERNCLHTDTSVGKVILLFFRSDSAKKTKTKPRHHLITTAVQNGRHVSKATTTTMTAPDPSQWKPTFHKRHANYLKGNTPKSLIDQLERLLFCPHGGSLQLEGTKFLLPVHSWRVLIRTFRIFVSFIGLLVLKLHRLLTELSRQSSLQNQKSSFSFKRNDSN